MTDWPEERVADDPRPPRLEPSPSRGRIVLGRVTVTDTSVAARVLETTRPPTWGVRSGALAAGVPRPGSARGSFGAWNGRARCWTLVAGDHTEADAGRSCPDPTPASAPLGTQVMVYAARMEACWVDGAQLVPRSGGCHGGWITPGLVGPFKGGSGTAGW